MIDPGKFWVVTIGKKYIRFAEKTSSDDYWFILGNNITKDCRINSADLADKVYKITSESFRGKKPVRLMSVSITVKKESL